MIHRFSVSNFKSLRDVQVDLSPVTVLVGRSGTGKTNFVQALRFLRDVLRSWGNAYSRQEKWTSEFRPATATDAPTRFKVEFSIEGVREQFCYEIAISKEGPAAPILSERLDLGKQRLFHQSCQQGQGRADVRWVVEPQALPLPKPGPIALGRIPSIHDVVVAYTALTSGLGCYAFSDSVLSGGKVQPSAEGLADDAANYLDVYKGMVVNLQDLAVRKLMVAALRKLNDTVSSVELDDLHQARHIVVGHPVNGKTLTLALEQESAGFRRFFAHLLALRQRPPKLTSIFEHPEDGIHPGALGLLADEFKAASQEGRGQVILTTHSPTLLDYFDDEQIRVVELDGLHTRIGPLADEQREALRDNLLMPGELLTVDPARLSGGQPEASGA